MGTDRSLGDFVDDLQEEEEEIATIDLANYPGDLPERMVLTFKHPSAPQLFQAQKTGKRLAVKFPEMTDEMGALCATMGLAHVSPAAEKPALLYARMALKKGKLFTWITGQFMKKFPDLADLEAKIDEAKKRYEPEI
jgi:hypothetical protein